MTIATMEELEALAPGTTVKVTSRRIADRVFTRTKDGFEFDGTTVEPRFFAGHVAAGQVVDFAKGDPEPGDLYVSGRRRYVILSVTDPAVWMMQFTDTGGYHSTLSRSLEQVRGFSWTKESRKPEWYPVAYPLAVQMRAVEVENQRVAEQWNEAQRELGEARLNLARMREERAAQVQVVATGVTRLPVEKAAGQVPDKVTVVDVVASWRREFTVTTEPAAGCQCGTISREQVAELLGITGQSEHADFGFQVNCGRH
jgi:hypothetical protein